MGDSSHMGVLLLLLLLLLLLGCDGVVRFCSAVTGGHPLDGRRTRHMLATQATPPRELRQLLQRASSAPRLVTAYVQAGGTSRCDSSRCTEHAGGEQRRAQHARPAPRVPFGGASGTAVVTCKQMSPRSSASTIDLFLLVDEPRSPSSPRTTIVSRPSSPSPAPTLALAAAALPPRRRRAPPAHLASHLTAVISLQ
jgi:hypothetical protein